MSESKKSGEFILNNLQILNEAVCFFEKHISPKVLHGIDNCIKKFANENDWSGNFQLEEKYDNWLQPKNWKNKDGLEARFEIKSAESDDDDNYWLALFCKNAHNNCEAGFFFGVETRHFGGKRAWDAHVRIIPEEQKNRLYEIGFKQFEGHFFLPITLSSAELAKSWLAEDPFTTDDECFEPLRTELEKLKQSIPIFEEIMASSLEQKNS
jgi:hypothetical protein